MTEWCLQLKTVKSSTIRVLFESLKEILTDVNILFDENSMKITSLDGSKQSMVHLKLDATNFELYKCTRNLVLGVNINSIYKLIKTVNNSDNISFCVDNNDISHLYIHVENNDRQTIYKYKVLSVETNSLNIQPKQFESVIVMPSSDFQKTCRDMNNLGAKYIDIKSIDDKLIFSCNGTSASQKTIIGGNSDSINLNGSIVQGVFELKYLMLFTKATNISPTVKIYLTNDYPLILEYDVSSLGTVKFILIPVNINS
jgi:proliferating cell nuclear antigen